MRFRSLPLSVVGLFLFVLCGAPASAQTITVTLQPDGESLGPIAPNAVVQFYHWGTVVYAGQPVGTYVIRRESLNAAAPPQTYPTLTVSVWFRLFGTSILAMQGASASSVATVETPYVGNVTVAATALAFLRGAAFSLTTVPVTGVQQGALTLQY